MTVVPIRKKSQASTDEWWRLSALADRYEPRMKTAYLRAMNRGTQVSRLELSSVITDLLVETCLSSANTYGIVFNPNSDIYWRTIENLVDRYVSSVESPQARQEVERILPKGLSHRERKERLSTFGLDARSAVRIERYRQEHAGSPGLPGDLVRLRQEAITIRGNLIALTETNRIINTSLEALWKDNLGISKALNSDVVFFNSSISNTNKIPKRARKEIVTRRDDRVCDYCEVLDGIQARIGQPFDTEYGMFDTPPFHPRCRCFVMIGTDLR